MSSRLVPAAGHSHQNRNLGKALRARAPDMCPSLERRSRLTDWGGLCAVRPRGEIRIVELKGGKNPGSPIQAGGEDDAYCRIYPRRIPPNFRDREHPQHLENRRGSSERHQRQDCSVRDEFAASEPGRPAGGGGHFGAIGPPFRCLAVWRRRTALKVLPLPNDFPFLTWLRVSV